eukprot:CAMPEP_0197178200 /NCGR_PEP_ID=MMETSP1423-20130617/3562_1 /TAXON_ID=476441 /ORGANISM="Pseudo-nitzschia heimii, Strain UNC1101" /LENGTH=281 /DNA_ID=CAMNT_0042627903 /DNA_START=133 /DNA_END=978 /DNA_ORIENTATION=+
MLPRTGDDNSKRRSSSSGFVATIDPGADGDDDGGSRGNGGRTDDENGIEANRDRRRERVFRGENPSLPPPPPVGVFVVAAAVLLRPRLDAVESPFLVGASEPASSGKTSSKDDDDDHVDGRLFSEEINVLYDSKCNVCKLEMDWLVSRDVRLNGSDRPRLKLTDLEDDYDATDPSNGGIDYATGMAAIYAVKHDGTVYKGVPVFEMAYDQVGLGWIWRINRVPAVNRFLEWGYEIFARNRTRITRGTPLEELLALHAAQRKDLDDGGCESCGTKHENNRLS